MGIQHIIYPQPQEEYIEATREKVNEMCPECGSNNVARYPVVCYVGPRIVIKCQDCFYRLRYEIPRPEDNWPPFQAATDTWISSIAG